MFEILFNFYLDLDFFIYKRRKLYFMGHLKTLASNYFCFFQVKLTKFLLEKVLTEKNLIKRDKIGPVPIRVY